MCHLFIIETNKDKKDSDFFQTWTIKFCLSRTKLLRLQATESVTSSCDPSLIGCSMWGSRWSNTPDRSPGSRTSHSSPPVSHNPTRPDMPPPYRPPLLPPPHSSSSHPQLHNTRLRPLHTPDTPPEPNTWTAARRRDMPGDSERNSHLQRPP